MHSTTTPGRHFLFRTRLFFGLCLAFIAACVAGTLSHEGGHIAVARYFGYSTELHYGSMHYFPPATDSVFLSRYFPYIDAIREQRDFPGREAYEAFQQRRSRESLLITLGGPAQTMLTGCLGLLLLFLFRKTYSKNRDLRTGQWLLVLLSLFWLRQPANLLMALGFRLLKGQFSRRADEIKIAGYLDWPFLSVTTGTALIGVLVLAFVYFRFIPRRQRITFLTAGMVGGVGGYVLWFYVAGPVLLP